MASWIPEIRQDQEALNEHSVSPRTGQSTRLNINGFRAQLPHEGIEFFTSVAPIDNHCGLTVDKQQQQSYHHPPPPAQIPIKGIEEQSVKPLLVIGMAFYNEEPEELRRTLVSLSDQVEELKHIVDCRIVIVSDGHFQMHGRTKAYLRALFSSK